MAESVELSRLVERAPGPLRTLRCRLHSWADGYVAATARQRRSAPMRPRGSAGVDWPGPDIHEVRKTIWYEPPGRWRVQCDGPPLNFEGELDIGDGEVRWEGDERRLHMRNYAPQLDYRDPAWSWLLLAPLLPWLRLGEPSLADYEGRRAWVIAARDELDGSATHRIRRPIDLTIAPGLDHRFTFDAQTGILLSHEATFEGAPCRRVELSEVDIDGPMDPSLFRPPPGAQVETG